MESKAEEATPDCQCKNKERLLRADVAERLEGALAAKLEGSERTLSKVWTFQLLLVGLSVLPLIHGWPAVRSVVKDRAGLTLTERSAAGLLALLLLYTFIRFGFVLGQFLVTRKDCDLVRRSLRKPDHGAETDEEQRLLDTTNFFEPLHQYDWFLRHRKGAGIVLWTLMSVATLVVAGSHVATVAMIHTALGCNRPGAWFVTFVVGVVGYGCYRQMLASEIGRDNLPARIAMAATLALFGIGCAVWFEFCI